MEKRICKQCGKKFVLSNGEIKFYKEKNLSLPKRCKKCREKNRVVEKPYIIRASASRKPIYAIAIAVLIILVALTGKLSLFNASIFNNNFDTTFESTVQDSNYQDSNDEDATLDNTQEEVVSEVLHSYTFSKVAYRDEHFEKHGSEFDYLTATEYEAGASRVVNSSEALHKIEKEDGDDVYYIESTNEFVIVATYGDIRTYFKPDDGIDYYNRQ